MKVTRLRILTLIGITLSLAACEQGTRTTEPNTGRQTEEGVKRMPGSEDRNVTSSDVGPGSPNAAKNEQVENEPRMEQHNQDQGHSGRPLDRTRKFDAEE